MNCEKRTVICRLYDANGVLLSQGRNHCDPPGGKCQRLGLIEMEQGYRGKGCGSVHAEVDAIAKLPEGTKPLNATLEGHDFACRDCLSALHRAGVVLLEVTGEKSRKVLRVDTGNILINELR